MELEFKDWIYFIFIVIVTVVSCSIGYDIGNTDKPIDQICFCDYPTYNQTDNCLEEVIDTLDEADTIRKRVMNYG